MGVNAQTEVPAFTAGQVLTAAEMTQINTGIPVFATTVTRDAAFGGAGEKVLAQGQYAYIEATSTLQVYTGAAWVNATSSSGLVLISATTIGTAVGSVTVSSAFSSTYDNYQIAIVGGATTGGAGTNLELTFGSTATGYYSQLIYATYNNTVAAAGVSNGSKFTYAGTGFSGGLSMSAFVGSPNLAKTTTVGSPFMGDGFGGNFNGTLQNSTQYTAFTVTASSGTLTAGTIYLYGYAKA